MNSTDIRRQLGMGMTRASHYDIGEQRSEVRVIDGTVICPVGETRNDFKNLWPAPVKLIVCGGKVQSWEVLWDDA